jgi:glucose-1-phosphate cytidylyltransferase
MMKAVILAGGLGTRLGDATDRIPKPMVEIGDRPILWHIMKIYATHGIADFIVCLGYKSHVIKDFFTNFVPYNADITFDLGDGRMTVHEMRAEPWRVTLVETGSETMTGGRVKRVMKYLDGEPSFCLTYGDGVGDIAIGKLIDFHRGHGRLATVTAVHTPPRFGALRLDREQVVAFEEKPEETSGWINGGFFVLSPGVDSYIAGDTTSWEREPLERLARDGQLAAFRHHGFWQPMDTLRDKRHLEELWTSGRAPWKVWP